MKLRSIAVLFAPLAVVTSGCQSESTSLPQSSAEAMASQVSDLPMPKTAILAGGCFWCVEADFDKLSGVQDVVSGYSGGTTESPNYKNYAAGGHREVVKVTYDPSRVTFAGLVEWMIKHSDATDGEGSFYDRGQEYAPAVYYETEAEKAATKQVIDAIDKLDVYQKPLAIKIEKRDTFWAAEDYHQNYAAESFVKYDYYRLKSGRDEFIKKHWGEKANMLELPSSIPKKVNAVGSTTVRGAMPWEGFQKQPANVLRKRLSDVQFDVTQQEGTESAFSNPYWDNKEEGIYVDVVSGEPLFSSADKYKSGTGWPSFVKPLDAKFIVLHEDNTLFTTRTEVRSKLADSHLGHVFDDGPVDRGGKRYCMNSAAMLFIPKAEMEKTGYANFITAVNPSKPTD